jgi:thioredoxin 1
MSAVSQVTTSEFETRAIQNDQLVVVDFSAAWCGPCKRLEPELEAAAQELQGKATILKVDVDADPDLATRFGVQGIPNLTFLKGGEVVDVIVGAVPRSTILARAKALL